MTYVPAGEFISGPPDAQKTRTLPAFYIDTQLVTNRKFFDFMRATGNPGPPDWLERRIPEGTEDLPVVNIMWDDAKAYAEWSGKRLPAVAEWEKAARGTDGRRYAWGNAFEPLRCNTSESGKNEVTAVGRYPRGVSPYGCYDMVGNVVQWCEDTGSVSSEEPDGRAVCGVSHEESGIAHGCWRVEFRKRIRRSRRCGFRCAMDV
jgi:formylglycine-generating enzyme required for sulfatase activity